MPDVARLEPRRPDLGRTAEAQRMDLGLLRAVPASLARRLRPAHDPVGRWRIKRQAEAVR